MPLQIGVYRDKRRLSDVANAGTRIIADWTLDAEGTTFSTDEFGFGACSFLVRMNADAAQRWKNSGVPYRVTISDGPFIAWEGEIRQTTATSDGLRVQALGFFFEYQETYRSRLGSSVAFSDWRIVTGDEVALRTPELYQIDLNNRLYITKTRNTTYTNNADIATLIFKVPESSETPTSITTVIHTYQAKMPIYTTARLMSSNVAFADEATEWSLVGTAGVQSGTVTTTLTTPRPWVYFEMLNTDGTWSTSQETGTWFFKITSVQVKTATNTTVLASAFIKDHLLRPAIGASASTGNIQTSTMDLPYLIIEDMTLLDAIKYLIPRAVEGERWAFEVWENRVPYFRPIERNDMPLYYVDDVVFEQTADRDRIASAVETTWKNELELHGIERATVSGTSALPIQSRFLTERQIIHQSDSSDSSQAVSEAVSLLTEHSKAITAGTITIRGDVFDEHGAVIPKWRVRKGSKLVLRRNHIINYWEDADSVIIGRTSYNVDTDELSVEPLDMPVTMETALANTSVFQDWNNPTFRNWG